MSQSPPRCFQNPDDATLWQRSARYAPAGSSSYCADCTRKFQMEMVEEGLCDHPDVIFVTNPQDGTTTGFKPKDPAQVELFEMA